MTTLHELHQQGQSPWLDYIRKDLIDNGELQTWIDKGVRGVTSNPTLFEQAIAKSDLYNADIARLAAQGKSTVEIYDTLSIDDITRAADVLRAVYDASEGADGFVSLEVSPELCDDHEQTVAEGRRLWKAVNRPNLMIKVPATPEGLLAIRQLIADGINVNVTLMFTLSDFRDVADAYMSGLEDRAAAGKDLSTVSSVASLFVSRVDSAVEAVLPAAMKSDLFGKVAIANVRCIYRDFFEVFGSARFTALKGKGARVQRPLFASTGVKSPALPDVLYVETLIGPDTVNTMPPQTLTAFLDHGSVQRTADSHQESDDRVLALCAQNGIDVAAIGAELKHKGLKSFADSFASLMQTIDTQRAQALSTKA
ncbi:MAG: transaldolase [Firmicutes bacterium]|nr:transaldolase [Bacillota bacterium]